VTDTLDTARGSAAVAKTEQLAHPPTRRPRTEVSRRLPYAFVILALVVGYLLGHSTDNPAPEQQAKQPNLVTPAQINAALTPSNGHAFENDRGFSALENGIQHTHGIDLPLTDAQRTELSRQMNLARETALRYPTLADAEGAGLRRNGPFSPGLGTHMIGATSYAHFAGAGPITDDQITHPLAWIYDGTKPDSKVAGLFYMSFAPKPEGFAGPNDQWHYHTNTCLVTRSDGGTDSPLGADRTVTKAQCDAVHGSLLKQTPPLLHVWVVPGYEDQQGVFAHLNPAITCRDGSYHTIGSQIIGTRASVCADGTE